MNREGRESDQCLTPQERRNQIDKEFAKRKPLTKDRIDLVKVRGTDLPGARDFKLPGPVELREEIQIQCRSQTYMDTLVNYMCNQCDNKGICKDSDNLTQKERAGLEELREGIKSKDWIVYSRTNQERWYWTPRKISLAAWRSTLELTRS